MTATRRGALLLLALALITVLSSAPLARASPTAAWSTQRGTAALIAREATPSTEVVGSFSTLTRDKWIGLGLAISSSLAIGTSFIITKKGLMDAAERTNGLASDGHSYLQNPIWWAGMSTMIVGEVANFAAYTFAPPILVTPLGALSVLIGAVLASFILKEELGRLGRVGCTLCLVGTVIIIMNAPEDKEIRTVDEILNYALQPGFLFYCLFVTGFAIFMIWRMVPKYGKRTPLVYISICSLVGSISVMSVKGFGVALKLTLDGNNQFSHPSTYCFAIVVIVCILVQMNYFNKALDQFSTNIVNPIYYVMFTTSTIFASFLLFRGFNTAGTAPAVSLLGGFVVIFMGVYLLNLNRLIDPITQQPRVSLMTGEGVAGTGRLSEAHDRLMPGRTSTSAGYPPSRRGSGYGHAAFSNSPQHHLRRDSGGSILFNAHHLEEAVGLTQLNETSEDDEEGEGDGMSPIGRQHPLGRKAREEKLKRATEQQQHSRSASLNTTPTSGAQQNRPSRGPGMGIQAQSPLLGDGDDYEGGDADAAEGGHRYSRATQDGATSRR